MSRLPLVIFLAVLPMTGCASTRSTAPSAPMATIDGKTINPDVERLEYVDPRYFGMSEAYAQCVNAPSLTASMMQGCASDEWALQRARLATIEQKLFALADEYRSTEEASLVLDPEQLRRSQASWRRYVDDDCNLRALRRGSTWGPATASECEAVSTAHRAQQLEDLLLSARGELERSFGNANAEGAR